MSTPPERFARDTNGTEADWRRWLPPACHGHPLSWPAPGHAQVEIGSGRLHLHWQAMPPRRIALATLPRLLVDYRFEGVDAADRRAFMQTFDLYMQRGGG